MLPITVRAKRATRQIPKTTPARNLRKDAMPARAQNKKVSLIMKFWFPVFVCMALIFLVSSIPQPNIPYVFTFQDVVFHLLKILTITIFFCILYAISDEFHQVFVPGRSVSALDVLMDGVGSVLAVGLNPFSGVAVGQDKGI